MLVKPLRMNGLLIQSAGVLLEWDFLILAILKKDKDYHPFVNMNIFNI